MVERWTDCYRCMDAKQKASNDANSKLAEAYGKVSESEYKALQWDATIKEVRLVQSDTPTLCEEYDIGIFDGVFNVSYSAWCRECGLRFEYKHEEKVWHAESKYGSAWASMEERFNDTANSQKGGTR